MVGGGPPDSVQTVEVYSIVCFKFMPDTIKPIDYLHWASLRWRTTRCLPSFDGYKVRVIVI